MNAHIIAPDIVSPKLNFSLLKLATVCLASLMAVAATTATADEVTAAVPTDAQIAKIVVVADTVDVNYGRLAVKKTSNPAVKEFAETMIRDHSAVNKKAIALVKKLGVTPEVSAISKSVQANGHAELKRLKALTGTEFDKAYIDNEVSYHEAVIGMLDKTLLPNTQNTELKALLESGRPIFVAHLEHAKKVQASLNQ